MWTKRFKPVEKGNNLPFFYRYESYTFLDCYKMRPVVLKMEPIVQKMERVVLKMEPFVH